jgi:hypothetical protein
MVSNASFILVNNRIRFVKKRYHIGDIVWWVDNNRITGIIYDSNETYCYIRDENNKEHIKSHLEIYLDDSLMIRDLLYTISDMKKEIHNLKHNLRGFENRSFEIIPPSRL